MEEVLNNIHITVLGARGSSCVSDNEYEIYGGATSCFAVTAGEELIVLDAGSGFMSFHKILNKKKSFSLLFSHFHIDHTCGLFVSPLMFDPDIKINMYSANTECGTFNSLSSTMREPIWPVGPEVFTSKINYLECSKKFNIGEVIIETMHGFHHGPSTIYRIWYKGKSIVYATDCQIKSDNFEMLKSFCYDTDLLLIDGQFTSDEMVHKNDFGHSDWQTSTKLAIECNAKALRIIHHAPLRTDAELMKMQEELHSLFIKGYFAKKEEEIVV